MTHSADYQRGFDDAKDAIGKMIAGGLSGIAGIRLIEEFKGNTENVKAADTAIKTMQTILDEIDTLKLES